MDESRISAAVEIVQFLSKVLFSFVFAPNVTPALGPFSYRARFFLCQAHSCAVPSTACRFQNSVRHEQGFFCAKAHSVAVPSTACRFQNSVRKGTWTVRIIAFRASMHIACSQFVVRTSAVKACFSHPTFSLTLC